MYNVLVWYGKIYIKIKFVRKVFKSMNEKQL